MEAIKTCKITSPTHIVIYFYFSISAFYCVCLPWPSNYFQQLFNVVGGIFPLHLALSRFNCENSRVKCNEKNSCFMLKTFLLLINYFIDFVLKSLAYKFHEIIQMTIKCHQNSLVTWLSFSLSFQHRKWRYLHFSTSSLREIKKESSARLVFVFTAISDRKYF